MYPSSTYRLLFEGIVDICANRALFLSRTLLDGFPRFLPASSVRRLQPFRCFSLLNWTLLCGFLLPGAGGSGRQGRRAKPKLIWSLNRLNWSRDAVLFFAEACSFSPPRLLSPDTILYCVQTLSLSGQPAISLYNTHTFFNSCHPLLSLAFSLIISQDLHIMLCTPISREVEL